MKKIGFLILTLISLESNAQFFTQFNIGYSFPIQTDRTTIFSKKNTMPLQIYNYHTIEDKINDTLISKAYKNNFTLIKGFYISMGGGYISKKNFRVSLNIDYFDNHSFNNINNDANIIENHEYIDSSLTRQDIYTTTFTCKTLTANPNIAYVLRNKRFSTEFFLGFNITTLWMFRDMVTNSLITNSEGNNVAEVVQKIKYKSTTLFNFNYGISLLYKLSDKMQLLFTSKFYYAQNSFYLPDKATFYYYSIDSSWGQNETNTNKYGINSYDGIMYFYKTIDFTFGLRYIFHRKEKAD